MALIKCHECQKSVSTEAAACPNCGAPVKSSLEAAPSNKKSGSLKNILVLLAILVIVIIVASGSPSGTSKEKRDESLKATVSASASGFSITNLDTFDWSNCDFQLNEDFEIKGINLASGKSVTIPAGQFATSKGTRFNLITIKPKEFYIYCRGTPGGTRSTMVGWK